MDLSREELEAVRASLSLGRRDNLSPVLTGVCLTFVGLKWRDWTDYVCVVWGLLQIGYFVWRWQTDRAIHKRAREIMQLRADA